MKLENQVVSLDLAKRLKELGVEQELEECSAYWDHAGRIFGWTSGEDRPYTDYTKAHSVAELGEMLPQYLDTKDYVNGEGWIQMSKNSDGWHVRYHRVKAVNEPTEADARAKMLVYLIENNLITL